MAQTVIDSSLIRTLTSQTGYEEVFEQAAHEKAWELLSSTLADANITNRALEKKRDYTKRVTERGVTTNKKLFIWTVLSKLRDAAETLDPDDIMSDFAKLKTGAEGAFEVFAGILPGDDTAPVINSDAPNIKSGTGVPASGTGDFPGQLFHSTDRDEVYVAKNSLWVKIA